MTRERVILLDTGFTGSGGLPLDGQHPAPCPFLVPVDLSLAEQHEHPLIRTGQDYLYKVHGHWYVGQAHRQRYGWNFSGWAGGNTIQFDAPGWNSSSWERLYELHDTGGRIPPVVSDTHDAQTGQRRRLTATPDPHGMVVEVDGSQHSIILDVSGGCLKVYLTNDQGEAWRLWGTIVLGEGSSD